MQFLHSASAMADTNMKKKDFARRTFKIRRAKCRRENPLFRRTKQHFRRAITCRHLLFCATNKFIRRTNVRRAKKIIRRARFKLRRARKYRHYTLRDEGNSVAQKKLYPPCILPPKISNPRFLTRRYIFPSR